LTTFVNVAYSPSMKFSLLSLSNLMKDGWKMSGNKAGIYMQKNGKCIVLEIIVNTVTGLA